MNGGRQAGDTVLDLRQEADLEAAYRAHAAELGRFAARQLRDHAAAAGVVAHTWGVEMKLTATGFAPGRAYQVAVLDTAGRAVDAGAFVGPGPPRCDAT